MDVLAIIYEALIADEYIKEKASGRIKYYEYPETASVTEPYIVIDPLDVPAPSDFADNTWLTVECLIQIDVWSPERTSTRLLAEKVQQVLWERLGLIQTGGISEHDQSVFRDARRYRGKLYRNETVT